jgi:multiple sugar transport system permease protein
MPLGEEAKMESALHKQVPINRFLKISLFYIVLGLLAVFMIGPFLWMATTAIKPLKDVYIYPPQLIPTQLSLANLQEVMTVIPIWRYLTNTFYVATVATLGQLVVCTMAAYSFSRLKFRGRDLMFTLYMGTMMIPFSVMMIPLFVLISKFGWQDNYAAIIVPSLNSAYGTFLLRQFFLTFPTELEDAARIDGCGRFRFLFTLLVPLSLPALTTLGLFNFLWRWNDFLWPMLVLHTQTKYVIQLGLAFFNGQYASSEHLLMTGATVSVIPLLILFVIAQRYYVQGVILSGLKG